MATRRAITPVILHLSTRHAVASKMLLHACNPGQCRVSLCLLESCDWQNWGFLQFQAATMCVVCMKGDPLETFAIRINPTQNT